MKGKTLLCLALVTSMLLSVFMIGSVGAPSTTVGVEPPCIINLGLGSGSWFTVEIWVRSVTDLAAVEFKLAYNTMILDVTKVKYGGIFGPDFPPDYFPLINETYDADGYLHYGIMEMFGQPGFTGAGIVATINFTVDSVGESVLDLYDTKLGDSPAQPIPHMAIDGYFRNALKSATLVKKSAWPEHHHYSISGDEDSSNDLFAIVCNDGDVDGWVKVVFTVTKDGTGFPVGTFNTTTMLLAVGATVKCSTAFVPSMPAKYYVSAQAWVDTDGNMAPDTTMGKIKSFSFSVVP